jgi:hypothetical protein
MLSVDLQIDADSVLAGLGRIPPLVRTIVRDELSQAASDAINRMTRESLNASARNTRTLMRRSGTLIRSFRYKTRVQTAEDATAFEVEIYQLTGLRGTLGANPAVYGPVLEYGATIRPRTKQWLTIPANPQAEGRRATAFSSLFFIPIDGQRAMLARRQPGSKRGIQVMYWLRKSVTIVGRGYFQRMYEELARTLPERLERAAERFLPRE